MSENERYSRMQLEGKYAVLEALKNRKEIEKIHIAKAAGEEKKNDAMASILSMAEKANIPVFYERREKLDEISETGKHQGVIAIAASFCYADISELFDIARKKGEPPFFILLDGVEDPHNLGAILRTANIVGAHGVIIPKRRSAGVTPTVAKTSAGAINYTPIARVSNLTAAIKEMKKAGMWFVCADMDGTRMYDINLTGPIGLVIGNEGDGVSRIVRKNCDFVASIPMKGEINSLNASVACGVLAYEIFRQRIMK